MAQIFDPLPSDNPDMMLCCYVNATSRMEIVRITNVPNWYFERVVFPGQRLVFEALSEAHLEIHCGMMASAILSDTIPCDRLRVQDETEAALSCVNPQHVEHQNEGLNEGLNEGVVGETVRAQPAVIST